MGIVTLTVQIGPRADKLSLPRYRHQDGGFFLLRRGVNHDGEKKTGSAGRREVGRPVIDPRTRAVLQRFITVLYLSQHEFLLLSLPRRASMKNPDFSTPSIVHQYHTVD